MARFRSKALQTCVEGSLRLADADLVKQARGFAPQRAFARMVGCCEEDIADYEAGRIPVPEYLRDYCRFYLAKIKPMLPQLEA